MNRAMQQKKYYSPVLVICIIIGLLAGLFLVHQRYQIEQAQHQIENIVEYDGVLRASSFEKRSTEDAFAALRDAGVTAMAIYDRTLEKAHDAGEIAVYSGEEARRLTLYGIEPQAGTTYVGSLPGKEGYYREIKEDLIRRVGQDKVRVLYSDRGEVLALTQPHQALMEMKLGISRLQAQAVSNAGFNVIVRPTNYKNETKADVEHVFNRIKGIPNVTGMVFVGKEALGYPKNLDLTEELLKENHIPVMGIEAVNQLQYDPQAGFDELAAKSEYSVGRLYTVTKEEMKKLSPTEVAQWFYISDIERNIRFNLYPIYEEGKNNETALQTSIGYMKDVKDKLEDRGFTFGRASVYPPYTPSPIALALTMCGSAALFVFMVNLFIPMKQHRQLVAAFTLMLLTIVAYVVTGATLITQVWALSAAICAPVVAIILLMNCWQIRSQGPKVGATRAMAEAAVYVIGAAILAAIGGIYIAAILGNTKFFMEFALFRGVKLVFVAPVILTAIAYLQRFPLWKGRTLHNWSETKQFIREFMTTDVKLYMVAVLAVLGGAAWVFVGRSGHTAGVPVPSFELALRRFLENTLYARPREKEFLIGHPAFLLAGYAVLRRWPMVIHFLLTIAGVIGIGSMVETFCHIRTPVLMSIARGLDGLWMGLVIGVIAVLIIRFLMYTTAWYQRRG